MGGIKRRVGLLHYSLPPVVGGVEAVIEAHTHCFLAAAYAVDLIAGEGAAEALPAGSQFHHLPLLSSQHPRILAVSTGLEKGEVPVDFAELKQAIAGALTPILSELDTLIVHNVLSKHFNLPLTAAICQLLDEGVIRHCIAWGHDFTWTSPNSGHKVRPDYPWDLLRQQREDIHYVTISGQRQAELAGLFGCAREMISVVYNGVAPAELLGLTPAGADLVQRLNLFEADLILLLPVRVTQAKNIEYALALLAALRETGLDARLIVTGPPDPHDENSLRYYRSLQARRDQLGLAGAMHFIYEAGPYPEQGLVIDLPVVADLYRLADILLLPSHREGFGMPVLEAGLLGMPVFAATTVPAAVEIGAEEIFTFAPDLPAATLAQQIYAFAVADNRLRLARQIRQHMSWPAIFREQIEPLLPDQEIA